MVDRNNPFEVYWARQAAPRPEPYADPLISHVMPAVQSLMIVITSVSDGILCADGTTALSHVGDLERPEKMTLVFKTADMTTVDLKNLELLMAGLPHTIRSLWMKGYDGADAFWAWLGTRASGVIHPGVDVMTASNMQRYRGPNCEYTKDNTSAEGRDDFKLWFQNVV